MAIRLKIRARQERKTYSMLQWVTMADDNVIVTMDEREAQRVRKILSEWCFHKFEDYDWWWGDSPKKNCYMHGEHKVMSAHDLRERHRGGRRRLYGIDNLEMVLPVLLGGPVAVATATDIELA